MPLQICAMYLYIYLAVVAQDMAWLQPQESRVAEPWQVPVAAECECPTLHSDHLISDIFHIGAPASASPRLVCTRVVDPSCRLPPAGNK